jgi:hypothetical protein
MNNLVVAVKTELIVSHKGETLSVRVYFKLNTVAGMTFSRCETVVNAGIPGEMVVEKGTYLECFHYCDAMVRAEEEEQAAMETNEHLEQS